MMGNIGRGLGAVVLGVGLLAARAAFPQTAEKFYDGRQLTFVVATTAGGGYDLYSRIFVEYLRRHLPGSPTIIVQNMGGAGGVKQANYMFNAASKDGSVIGMPISAIIVGEAIRPDRVKFRTREFGWIGTISTMTDVLAVFADTGVKTIEDAKHKSVVMGATGKTSTGYLETAMANALLGTKFKIVEGYKSGNEMNLAMDSQEINGRANQWDSWRTQRPQWIREDKLSYLLQYGPKLPALGKTPAIIDLVTDPEQKKMVEIMQIIQLVGRSIFMPPQVPHDRLAFMRAAFDKTVADPVFVAQMKAKNLDLDDPRSGAALEADLDRIMPSAKETGRNMKKLLNLP